MLPVRAPAAVPLLACETANLNLALACFQEQQPQSDHTVHTKMLFFFFLFFKSSSGTDFKGMQAVWCFQESLGFKNQEPECFGTLIKSPESAFEQGTQPLEDILSLWILQLDGFKVVP